jgi:hypothetical protein
MIARLLDWWRKLGDGPMEEDDPEWQTVLNKVEVACKGITLRQLVRPPALKLNKSLGSLRRVCIARDPIEIDELMAPKRRPTCALCGKTTEEGLSAFRHQFSLSSRTECPISNACGCISCATKSAPKRVNRAERPHDAA